MTDMSPGARAPDRTAPHPHGGGGLHEDRSASTAKEVANQGARAAGHAASEVTDTAKEQAQRVGAEAKTQVRNVTTELRERMSEQARTQNGRLVGAIRQAADQLEEMRADRADSPATMIVARVAEGGHDIADYLDRNGPEGVLREVEDFARRRPGAFLATALAAGFLVGRLGKGIAKGDGDAGQDKPASDAFVSGLPRNQYQPAPVTTEYAATGSGTPRAVNQYADGGPAHAQPGGRR